MTTMLIEAVRDQETKKVVSWEPRTVDSNPYFIYHNMMSSLFVFDNANLNGALLANIPFSDPLFNGREPGFSSQI